MDKSKRFMYISIIILLISVVSSIGTYAWFTWTSTDNTSVTLSIGKLADVTFESGPDININNLAPVFNYTDGVSTTFSINNRDTSGSSLLYRVKFNITNIDNELKNNSMKYTLLKGTSVVAEGNFSSTTNGTILNLGTSSLTNGTSNYTLYFWIDGNEENDLNMMNKNLSGTIEVSIESNILTRDSTNPSSGTSTFLNSTLTRESIESVNISGTNTEPLDSLGSFDVSKNQDNSITMWYTDTDNDNLYEVTIGSADNNTIYANSDSSRLFAFLSNATNLDINNLDTSAVTDMSYLLYYDSSLVSIDLSNFNTLNVTDMSSMFHWCDSLISLDLSSFDTGNVTNMLYMFYRCDSLISLDVSNFDTSKVTNMLAMFQYCTKLPSLDVSNFDTSKVTTMSTMFAQCFALTSLDVSHFNTSNVTDMRYMFGYDYMLGEINGLENFNTSNVTDMNCMFVDIGIYLSEKINLNLSSFTTSKVTNTKRMLSSRQINIVDLSNANFSNITDSTDMFLNVPTSATIKLKDTLGNRTFMNTNFPSYTPTYVN